MFVPLGVAVVFLSSHFPDEGGLYVWGKRAFGPFAGFMTGWTYWASVLPYFAALLYFAAGNALFIGGASAAHLAATPGYFIVFALVGLTLATIVNVYGLEVGKWLNSAGAVCRWVVTLLLIALGAIVWWRFGPATPMTLGAMRPSVTLKDVIFWSVIAFAWTGPEGVSFMGGEIKSPRRTVPLGLALAAPAIATIYILGTMSVLAALMPHEVNASSGVMQAIDRAAARMAWNPLTPVAAVLVTVSCLGSTGAWLGATARLPFVAGIDHYLPAAFGRTHPRWGSPVVALLTQAGFAALFIFLGQGGTSVKGAYDVLVGSTVLITMVPFLFLFGAAMKFSPLAGKPDSLRVPGGRWTVLAAGMIGFATTLLAMIFAGFPAGDDPNKLLAVVKIIGLTALMILSGVVVYAVGRQKALRAASLSE